MLSVSGIHCPPRVVVLVCWQRGGGYDASPSPQSCQEKRQHPPVGPKHPRCCSGIMQSGMAHAEAHAVQTCGNLHPEHAYACIGPACICLHVLFSTESRGCIMWPLFPGECSGVCTECAHALQRQQAKQHVAPRLGLELHVERPHTPTHHTPHTTWVPSPGVAACTAHQLLLTQPTAMFTHNNTS